jgi:pimeloyl-ACP methyl ester carboxylesterase
VAELARRDFGGEPVTDDESERVLAAFGPRVPDADELGRAVGNPAVNGPGMELVRRLDVVDQLAHVTCPTLVCVGALDPVSSVADAEEIMAGLPAGLGRLEVIDGAGHFPWLDRPERLWSVLTSFLTSMADGQPSTRSSTADAV